MRREWIEILFRGVNRFCDSSPSMRREWIEMDALGIGLNTKTVSLHAEGVD